LKHEEESSLKHHHDVERLHGKFNTLKNSLSIFVEGTKNHENVLKYKRNPFYIYNHGYRGKKYVHDESVDVYYLCGKIGHVKSKCKHLPRENYPSLVILIRKDPCLFGYLKIR